MKIETMQDLVDVLKKANHHIWNDPAIVNVCTIDDIIEALQGKALVPVALIENITGHNAAVAYENDDDDVGHCAICRGWNMHHSDDCEILKLGELLKASQEKDNDKTQ